MEWLAERAGSAVRTSFKKMKWIAGIYLSTVTTDTRLSDNWDSHCYMTRQLDHWFIATNCFIATKLCWMSLKTLTKIKVSLGLLMNLLILRFIGIVFPIFPSEENWPYIVTLNLLLKITSDCRFCSGSISPTLLKYTLFFTEKA